VCSLGGIGGTGGLWVRSEGLGIHLVWRHREGSEGTFLCHFSSLGAGGSQG